MQDLAHAKYAFNPLSHVQQPVGYKVGVKARGIRTFPGPFFFFFYKFCKIILKMLKPQGADTAGGQRDVLVLKYPLQSAKA
jgi:hypothetical protein